MKEMPEKAEVMEDVIHVVDDNIEEVLLFHLRDSKHEFMIGLFDILECIEFAEKSGFLPEIPLEWWLDVKTQYNLMLPEEREWDEEF